MNINVKNRMFLFENSDTVTCETILIEKNKLSQDSFIFDVPTPVQLHCADGPFFELDAVHIACNRDTLAQVSVVEGPAILEEGLHTLAV